MATNDNNNFGKHNMGDENWAPSSRVLAQPGGNSTIQLGWDDEPAAAAPARDTSRPRIIGGKIVYSQEDKQKCAPAALCRPRLSPLTAAPPPHRYRYTAGRQAGTH